MSYYYLASSLPMLHFGSPAPITMEAFREQCREHLRAADLQALEALEAPGSTGEAHAFVRAWREAEVQISNTIVRHRAALLKRDPQAYCREEGAFDGWLNGAVHEALTRHNPLDREQALDRARWKQLEELAGTDSFAPAAILVYALQLRILERWESLTPDTGNETLNALVRRDEAGEEQAA